MTRKPVDARAHGGVHAGAVDFPRRAEAFWVEFGEEADVLRDALVGLQAEALEAEKAVDAHAEELVAGPVIIGLVAGAVDQARPVRLQWKVVGDPVVFVVQCEGSKLDLEVAGDKSE